MRILAVLLFSACVSSPVAAEPGLKARDGWIREAPPTARVRAGYLVLGNDGDTAREVIAARSPAFGAIEIHEMVATDDGTMRMRPVPVLPVAAGAEVALAPGGLHLMLFRPVKPLAAGDRVTLVLDLADGGALETELEQR